MLMTAEYSDVNRYGYGVRVARPPLFEVGSEM